MSKTTKNCTVTTEGAIPHLQHKDGYLCPVKLEAQGRGKLRMVNSLPIPQKAFGQYIYALPGGGEILGVINNGGM